MSQDSGYLPFVVYFTHALQGGALILSPLFSIFGKLYIYLICSSKRRQDNLVGRRPWSHTQHTEQRLPAVLLALRRQNNRSPTIVIYSYCHCHEEHEDGEPTRRNHRTPSTLIYLFLRMQEKAPKSFLVQEMNSSSFLIFPY